MIDVVEYVGVVLALFGSVFIARNDQYSKWGFVLFLMSCILFMFWSFIIQKWGLMIMNIIYMFVNLFGIYRWFNWDVSYKSYR
jgi:hypothetical protein